ncbi:PAS domain S-box protein [Microcoleus sp. B5-D4]|uniref:PAS domain S-box protein n=1 Tax=unclassified Microcoleus TaxID=2642155 RepID=UPI002FD2CDC5
MIEHTDEDYGKWQQQPQPILAKTALSLSASLKLEDILNTTVTDLRNILQCDRVIIFQFAPDWSGKVVVESVGSEWTAILSTQIHDPCFAESYIEPFKQGLFTSKSDIDSAGIDTCHREFLANFQVRANLVIPILEGEELWGLLIAHHCPEPREWQPSEIELMRQLATQIGIAIQQADLFDRVQTELRERQQAEIALQQLNTELEQRVIERTAELTEINHSLQQYINQVEDLYNNAPCGYHSLDAAGTIIRINDTELKWLGYTRDEIVHKKNYRDLMTLESKKKFDLNFPLFKKQGWLENLDFQILNKNGKLIWINLSATAIYDEAGNFMMSRSSVFDITERKLTEEAFRQYERILFHTTDMIVLMNSNYIYQIVNQAYLTWCNKSESEVIGNSVRNILDADVFDHLIKPRLDRCLAGETIQYENWFDSPNLVRQFLSVTYTPLRDIGEKIVGVIVSLRDLTKLKQAEQMLELQAVITRNMAEGICLVRADNAAIVYANPKFERMFGYDFGELNGQHVAILNYGSESVSPEDVNQAIRSAVLQNSEFSYEVQNVKKDGTPFWCSATCSVFNHSEYGDVLVAVHQDITVAKYLEEVRQEAEAALLQKSRKEHLLWRITQGIRQSLDLNAVLNTAVTEIRQTLQTDRTAIYRFNHDWSGDFIFESVGEDWVKLIGSDLQNNCVDTYLQETHGGRFRNNESFVVNNIYCSELQPCHIELVEQLQAKSYAVFPIFLIENLWGLLAIYQNTAPRQWQSWEIELLEQIASQLSIAIQQSQLYRQLQVELQERQQAEATIREAERRWRSLLDNVQLIVVGLDIEGNVNYVNPFFLKITGYTYLEVMGKDWFKNFLPCSLQASIKVVFSEVLAHKYHPYCQNPILTKSGEERFIAWNNTMLQDSEGNIIGTISIGEDITERQKLEQIKNEFIGIVSHELRTPLAGIQMSLGLIKSGVYDKKPEKSRRMIEIAHLDTNRLVNLVNDILDLERLDSGRAIVEKTVCQAADLMQQAVDSMQAIATQQQISLIVTPTAAEVWATRDAIVQTLTNLLSNAIKFSPADSTIHLSAQNQTDFVLFQVSDRGRGIPADKLELIFGRFQQVDASDSREKGGTGLGLAICRSIVERHGGKIWAESILGEGSTFCFTLPLPTIE